MDYHLHHNGQNLGSFSLEDLRLRHARGELSGAEFVWCEGMAHWQPLGEILAQHFAAGPTPPPLPPPLPPARPKSSGRLVVYIIGGVVVVGLVGMIFTGLYVRSVFRRALQVSQVVRQEGRDGAHEVASAPVVVTNTSLTEVQLQPQRRAFRLHAYLDDYKEHGERNPATDARCLGFLQNWIAENNGGDTEAGLPAVSELAEQLGADPQCTDPLVQAVAAVYCADPAERVRRLRHAQAGFESSRHLGYPKFYAAVMLAQNFNSESRWCADADALALRRLREALHDGSVRPEDQADLAETLLSGWGETFNGRQQGEVLAVVKQAGNSFAWLALVLEGRYDIDQAWKLRGDGYANTVTEAGWKGFAEKLSQAKQCLTQAWQLRPDLPQAPAQMIEVALGQSDIQEMRRWFDRTTIAQFDYPGAWQEMRWGLRPRWYGDLEAMLAFGITAANTRRYDTDVPRKLIDSLNDLKAEQDVAPGEYLFGRADIWPHVQEMYEGYIAAQTTPEDQRGWRSAYTVVAYLGQHYDVARQQLEAVHWQPQPGNLTGWERDLSLLSEEVAARTGDARGQVAIAEGLRAEGNAAGALKIYATLTNAAAPDERVRRFVQDRVASLGLERRLQTHDWIDFLPAAPDLAGWCAAAGDWKPLPSGELEVRSGGTNSILFSRADASTSFEIRGDFEVMSAAQTFEAGLVFGLPEPGSSGWYSFRMRRDTSQKDVASLSSGWSRRQINQPIQLKPGRNSFTLRYVEGKVSATVNDSPVFQDTEAPRNSYIPSGEFLVGFGVLHNENPAVIRYGQVQLRRL